MKRIVAVFAIVAVLFVVFSLTASAISQSVGGSVSGSTATFVITVSAEGMTGCSGSVSVTGGTITSIGGSGSFSSSGNSFSCNGVSGSASITVVCKMTGDAITLSPSSISVFSEEDMIGVTGGVTKTLVRETTTVPAEPKTTKKQDSNNTITTAPTTTTTEKDESTTETTSEKPSETTTEDKTTTTTTEIVIAPINAPSQNGGGLGTKYILLVITIVAVLVLAFAVGMLLGRRRNEALTFNSEESISDILGEIENDFEESADE